MAIRAVIFDRDNTLVHFEPSAVASLEARVSAAVPGLPPRATVEHWLSWPGPWPRTPADEPAFWSAFWGGLLRAHRFSERSAAALQAIGGFYHTCFAFYPDTPGCLETLRARGLRLAILTNFELPSIDLTLRHTGLAPEWFDALLSSAATGFHKPDPRAYLAAASALGLQPAECAFVDDLPENVAAARALGMRAWQIDRVRSTSDDPHTIHSLSDLSKLLV
jgi:putative hydrolase of the HAD superfamily